MIVYERHATTIIFRRIKRKTNVYDCIKVYVLVPGYPGNGIRKNLSKIHVCNTIIAV